MRTASLRGLPTAIFASCAPRGLGHIVVPELVVPARGGYAAFLAGFDRHFARTTTRPQGSGSFCVRAMAGQQQREVHAVGPGYCCAPSGGLWPREERMVPSRSADPRERDTSMVPADPAIRQRCRRRWTNAPAVQYAGIDHILTMRWVSQAVAVPALTMTGTPESLGPVAASPQPPGGEAER